MSTRGLRMGVGLGPPRSGSLRRLVKFVDPSYFVAYEGDEGDPCWGSTVDPVFGVVALGVPFADFFVGGAEGGRDHVVVHADHSFLTGDGLARFGREGVYPIHSGRLLFRKIEERRKLLLDVVRTHFRNGAS